LVAEARKDLAMAEEALSQNEAELAVVKEQRDLLSQRLREEKGRNTMLEQQKTALQSSLDDALEKLVSWCFMSSLALWNILDPSCALLNILEPSRTLLKNFWHLEGKK
jgi:hypothetical protein